MLLAPFSRTTRSYQASLYDPLHPETTSSSFSSSCSDKRQHLPLSNARMCQLSKEEVCSPDHLRLILQSNNHTISSSTSIRKNTPCRFFRSKWIGNLRAEMR